MFERVLVSVPSEHFPQLALERAANIEELYSSKIYLSYIIEDNVFEEVSDQLGHVLTDKEGEKFQKKMAKQHEKMAKKVILKEAKKILGSKPNEISVQKGKFSKATKDEIDDSDADLLLMEYDSFNLMKYRIMDSSPVPVWIERKSGPIKKIGLFCTNLSPNIHSLKIAKKLKRGFSAKLSSYFVNDPKGKMDRERSKELSASHRIKWTEVVDEKVDTYIYRKAKEEEFDLIILGRIKKRGYFHMRSNFAKRTDCSVLLIN